MYVDVVNIILYTGSRKDTFKYAGAADICVFFKDNKLFVRKVIAIEIFLRFTQGLLYSRLTVGKTFASYLEHAVAKRPCPHALSKCEFDAVFRTHMDQGMAQDQGKVFIQTYVYK